MITRSKRFALKSIVNKAESFDLRIENFDSVKTDELVNALDQMLKIFHLHEENQSKNSFDDHDKNQSVKIIQLRRFDKKRRVSKLAEKII